MEHVLTMVDLKLKPSLFTPHPNKHGAWRKKERIKPENNCILNLHTVFTRGISNQCELLFSFILCVSRGCVRSLLIIYFYTTGSILVLFVEKKRD